MPKPVPVTHSRAKRDLATDGEHINCCCLKYCAVLTLQASGHFPFPNVHQRRKAKMRVFLNSSLNISPLLYSIEYRCRAVRLLTWSTNQLDWFIEVHRHRTPAEGSVFAIYSNRPDVVLPASGCVEIPPHPPGGPEV